VAAVSGFEFLAGAWDVANRRRQRWLAGCDDWDEFPATSACWSLFGGAANLDEITFPTKGFTGLTLRLYEPATKVWTLNWVNSRDGRLTPPVTGGFTGDVGTFYGDDSHEGQDVRVRYLWSRITRVSARWEQAYSIDGGQDWETNWVMDFTRRTGNG
jgi:hypothetical protein